MLPGGPLASLIRSRYWLAEISGSGPSSTIFVPPDDDPPAGPSVKSQALPFDSLARLSGPAAACACASVAKVSTRQKSGPAGSLSTFFSTTGLTTSVPAPAVPTAPDCARTDGVQNPARTSSATTTVSVDRIGHSPWAVAETWTADCGRVGALPSQVSGEL